MVDLLSYTDSTTTTWYSWNTGYDAGTATSDGTWYAWNSNAWNSNTGTATTTNDVWLRWNGQYWQASTPQPARELTPAELQEQARIEREYEDRLLREAAECRRRAEEADARAELLLKANLQAEQLQEFEKRREFTVISQDGQRRYRVRRGWQHNVERIDEAGKRLHTLCAHPRERVSELDNMLVQKLWLEHDEEDFLQIANKGAT